MREEQIEIQDFQSVKMFCHRPSGRRRGQRNWSREEGEKRIVMSEGRGWISSEGTLNSPRSPQERIPRKRGKDTDDGCCS